MDRCYMCGRRVNCPYTVYTKAGEQPLCENCYFTYFATSYRYLYDYVKEEGERCIEEGLIPQEEVN